jgi:hypothetical protein
VVADHDALGADEPFRAKARQRLEAGGRGEREAVTLSALDDRAPDRMLRPLLERGRKAQDFR